MRGGVRWAGAEGWPVVDHWLRRHGVVARITPRASRSPGDRGESLGNIVECAAYLTRPRVWKCAWERHRDETLIEARHAGRHRGLHHQPCLGPDSIAGRCPAAKAARGLSQQ